MDKMIAERILSAASSLDRPLNDIDTAISAITDPAEKQTWAAKLGQLFHLLNDEFIRPIAREFPDLDPDG